MGYLFTSAFWGVFCAAAYWNDHPFAAVFFAGLATSNMTAASLDARMDRIDTLIDQRVDRIWEALTDLGWRRHG